DIENHHVYAMFLQLLERFLVSPRFRNHIEIGLADEQCPNTLANEDVAINDDDVDQIGAPRVPWADSRSLPRLTPSRVGQYWVIRPYLDGKNIGIRGSL